MMMRTTFATAFRTAAAILSVASPVETMQTHQPAEAERKIEVKIQYAVFRADEGPGDPDEEPAVYPVQKLGKVTMETGKEAIVFRHGPMEGEGQTEILYGDLIFRISRFAQAVVEGSKHFFMGEIDGGFQTQVTGTGKDARQKGSEPPVLLGKFYVGAVCLTQMQRAGEHFVFVDGREMRHLIFCLGQQPVGMIGTDFRSGVDAVLAFPEFDQPCSAPVIEVDRKGIEDHLEPGSHIVVEPGIAGGLLPGIQSGGEETAAAVVSIAEGRRQFLQKRTFLTFIHAFDFADDLFSAEMAEKHTDKSDQK